MASKVSGIIEKILTGGSSGTVHAIASTAYGVCDTAANEQYKNVDMTGFKLEEGVTIHVKFANANSADNPKLKFNSEANENAKPIVLYGTTAVGKISETTGWNEGAVLTLTYDGTSWVRDQGFNTNDSVSQSASTTASWRKILLSNNTYAATDTAVAGARGAVYEAVGVSVLPSTGTLHATIFDGNLNGNASSSTLVKVTNLAFPSSNSLTYYLTLAGSTTTGNLDIKDSAHLYLWENTTSSYLNIGSSGTIGAISLWNGTGHVNIIPTTLTANATLTLTLPNASGTVALMSNLSDYLPLTGGRVTGDITLYTSGTGNTPSLVFQREDTIGGSYYDWRILDTGGKLTFQDIGSHTSNTWTTRFEMYTDTLTGKFAGPLTGNATSASALANTYTGSTRPSNANITHVNDGGVIHFKATSSMTSNKPMGDGNILHFYWDNGNAWNALLYIPDASSSSMQYRPSVSAGNWADWRTIIDNENYSTYLTEAYGIEIIGL